MQHVSKKKYIYLCRVKIYVLMSASRCYFRKKMWH